MKFIYYINANLLEKEEFDRVVGQVLKKAEYRRLQKDYIDIIEKVRNTIMEWLEVILEKLFSMEAKLGTSAFGISNGIVIICLILLVILVIVFFLSMKKVIGKSKTVKTIYGEKISSSTKSEDLRNKAIEYREHGDYREAIRVGFISLLLKMNEKNLLYLDPTKTNEEMANILRNKNFIYVDIFQSLIYLFNEAWFGHKKIHEEEFYLWEEKLDELWNGVLNIEAKE